MKKSFKQHHALLLISLFFFACEGTKTEDCATTEDGRGHVISVLPMGTISAKFMNDFLADNNIDIGVIPKSELSARQMQSIKGSLEELPTLIKIDFIDFSSVSDEFKSIALMNTKDIIFD